METRLLKLLPDAAKLNILRHLEHDPPTDSGQQQQEQHSQLGQQPALRVVTVKDEKRGSGIPPIVAERRLIGGLAIIDAFLDVQETQAVLKEAQQALQQHQRAAAMVTAGKGEVWTRGGLRGDQAAWLSPAALREAGQHHLAVVVRRLLALQPWLQQQGFDVSGRPSCQLARFPGGGARFVRHRDASASVPYRTVTVLLYLNPAWAPAHGGQLCVYQHATSSIRPLIATPADLHLAAAAGAAEERPCNSSSNSSCRGEGEGGAGIVQGGDVSMSKSDSGSSRGGGGSVASHMGSLQQQGLSQQQTVPCSGLDEGHPGTLIAPVGGRLVVMDSRLLHEVLPAHAERYALTVWFARGDPAAAASRVAAMAEAVAGCATAPAQAAAAGAVPAEGAVPAAAGAIAALDVQSQDSGSMEVTPTPEQGAVLRGHNAATSQQTQRQRQQDQQQGQQQQEQQQDQQQGQQQGPQRPLNGAAISAPGCIFVSVAAYRDSETQWTLADLFAKAAHPELLRVGVVWQLELPADAAMLRLAGEQRWLGQIDSHMRFVQGWDAALLRMLRQAEAAAGHPRVVLSAYPPGYEGEGLEAVLPAAPLPSVLCASGWGERDRLLRICGRKLRQPLAAPAPAIFWAAGFSFSRSQLIEEVAYSRDFPGLFFGEEMLQLVRMWRRGWDMFAPCEVVAWHLWSRKHRPTYQADRQAAGGSQALEQQREASQDRVSCILKGLLDDAAGPPVCRSLEAFWEHCGVGFRQHAIADRARNGGMPPHAFLQETANRSAAD
ncbi:[Skp1-protein]-hydroxyproline N-acetylglucosaminyltransferase [Chlorella vulgaris]